MEQVQTRKAIQEEGKQAARDGKGIDACRYDEGTEAREEWHAGYCQACARAVVAKAALTCVAVEQ